MPIAARAMLSIEELRPMNAVGAVVGPGEFLISLGYRGWSGCSGSVDDEN